MIVLLRAEWYMSQNAGDEVESIAIAVFDTRETYEAYIAEHYPNPLWFDHTTWEDNQYDSFDSDSAWLYYQTVPLITGADNEAHH